MSGDDLDAQVRALLAPLAPEQIALEDQSAAHAGHAGAKSGAHLRLRMVSPAFRGLSRLERHRLVYERLSALMATRIHALTMELVAPGE
jgi:BolA family transcriptional regulator, general stress-responsive regulator